ncbi:MAG TPA: methyltransferase domain-containing protein [Longimicrobiaceae bacterium]|nr:methyltransferase domain-containing protein [Longimicrobiaceae bacterium]
MPGIEQLADYRRHAEWALVAATAHELRLLEELAEGPTSAADLAARLGLSPRGVGAVLGVLEELALVRRDGERYGLTEEGRAAFVARGSPAYQGDAIRLWLQNVRRWTDDLGRAVREGGPPRAIEAPGTGDASDPEALARFMAAMDNKPVAQVEAVVEACLARAPHARDVLDLGGGPGTFARAFARRGLHATLFDRPEVIEHVAERYDLRSLPELNLQSGDFLETPPAGEFDIILQANITHIYDPATNTRLITSLVPRLRPGGVLAILDFVRGFSEFAPLFAITMLLNTEQGGTYSLEEYARWLEEAGLDEVRCTSIDADRQLVTAVRGQ